MSITPRVLVCGALACVSAVLSSCASGPELDKFDRRELDRSYTLPKGVAAWHILAVGGEIRDDSSSTTLYPVPLPLVWETSLSDDWNLIFAPLPLGVSHQFANTETARYGITLLTGFRTGSISGFRLLPTLAFSSRFKLSRDLAVDVTPNFQPDIPFKGGQKFLWSAGVELGPVFQVSDRFSWGPRASLDVSYGKAPGAFSITEDLNLVAETSFVGGLGLNGTWVLGRQWDLRAGYGYSGLGARNGFRAHLGILDLTHYW
jgi:hypothetical protein